MQTCNTEFAYRDKFVEYSYLRAADKKHHIPEHIEKTVLFLADASEVATADTEKHDWDDKAGYSQAAEEEATAAVKAAWRAAKGAKEVSGNIYRPTILVWLIMTSATLPFEAEYTNLPLPNFVPT